jgi:hypothetical protein
MSTPEQSEPGRYLTNDESLFLILFRQYEECASEVRRLRRRQTRLARDFAEHMLAGKYPAVRNLSPGEIRRIANVIIKSFHDSYEQEQAEEAAAQL